MRLKHCGATILATKDRLDLRLRSCRSVAPDPPSSGTRQSTTALPSASFRSTASVHVLFWYLWVDPSHHQAATAATSHAGCRLLAPAASISIIEQVDIAEHRFILQTSEHINIIIRTLYYSDGFYPNLILIS